MATKLCASSIVLFLLTGCCGALYGYQAPAPVYEPSPYETSEETISDQVELLEKTESISSQEIKGPKSSSYSPDKNARQLSPAVLALIAEADTYSNQGDLDTAVVTIERALRIDSRNPVLTYKLAELRLQQFKPSLAEDLAKKAALLSENDKSLKKQCWLLISEARKQQNNQHGANEARLKADQL